MSNTCSMPFPTRSATSDVTPLYLLEPPGPGYVWSPFDGVRPVAEMRAGAFRLRDRWQRALGLTPTAILGASLETFQDTDSLPLRPAMPIDGPAIVAASWFAAGHDAIVPARGVLRLTCGDATVAWLVPAGARWEGPTDRGVAQQVDGIVLRGTFDLLTALDALLAADCAALAAAAGDSLPDGTIVFGERGNVVSRGASVEPGVVFDVRNGAVILEAGAEIRHGTRIEGPCYVGEGTRVLGGFVRTSVFGPRCVVRGEIASSAFFGYANKSHDGFVGSSIVGQWVNLGAGTTTSNLKNTYGPVRLDVAGHRLDTGRLNVGSLIGDHAKTAIGTMLATGTVIGAGANVFGDEGVPKYVLPFAWGSRSDERLSEEGFLRIAERVMPRRNVTFTDEIRQSLAATYRRLTDGL